MSSCSKTISAPTLLRGGNSESMWNMMLGTNLVIKSLGCIQNGGLQQSLCKPEYIYV